MIDGGISITRKKQLSQQKILDDKSKKYNKNTVWTSKYVQDELDKVESGEDGSKIPFFEGDIQLKAPNIVFEFTQDELLELSKCANSVIYFAQYCKVMTDDGIQCIELREYQKNILKCYQYNRNIVFLASRQIGKTICSGIFIAWYICFHSDRNIMIVANKLATTSEIIDKVKVILRGLPYYMKPGVMTNAVNTMKFDNGVRMFSQATTKSAAIGFTVHLLYADEFAHIPSGFIKQFYRSIFPTMSSSLISRIIITSTANGLNLFYDIYQGAIEGKNTYKNLRTDWWEVPGRDERWREKETGNLGSDELFNQEYGNQFMSSTRLLLDTNTLRKINRIKREYKSIELIPLQDHNNLNDCLSWIPGFNIDKYVNSKIAIGIDLADGIGRDYTVFNIFLIEPQSLACIRKNKKIKDESSFFRITQIGIFRSNIYSVKETSFLLEILCFQIFNPLNISIALEVNFKGHVLYDNIAKNKNFYEELFLTTFHSIGSSEQKMGIRINKENRDFYFRELRELIRENKIVITHNKTVEELSSFGVNDSGKYTTQLQNDDCAMSTILLVEYLKSEDFQDAVEDIFDTIPLKHKKLIDNMVNIDDENDELSVFKHVHTLN